MAIVNYEWLFPNSQLNDLLNEVANKNTKKMIKNNFKFYSFLRKH